MTNEAANPFWAFSWSVYQEPGVARACLALQDREGLDVNILLFCCWAGHHGHELSADQFQVLREAARDWQVNLIAPVRGARRWLKTVEDKPQDAESLRERLKDLELAAERLEQDLLYAALPLSVSGNADMNAVVSNLQTYFNVSGRTPGPEDTADMVAIVLAAMPRSMHALDLVRRFEETTQDT